MAPRYISCAELIGLHASAVGAVKQTLTNLVNAITEKLPPTGNHDTHHHTFFSMSQSKLAQTGYMKTVR